MKDWEEFAIIEDCRKDLETRWQRNEPEDDDHAPWGGLFKLKEKKDASISDNDPT